MTAWKLDYVWGLLVRPLRIGTAAAAAAHGIRKGAGAALKPYQDPTWRVLRPEAPTPARMRTHAQMRNTHSCKRACLCFEEDDAQA